jgi:hypothetical protein
MQHSQREFEIRHLSAAHLPLIDDLDGLLAL